jgi:hypothetical protein
LLAAIHRVCQPGPKTEVADWYDRTILRSQWGFAPERFTSQEFWDCFDRIPEEQLDQAQIRLLGLWKEKQLVSRSLLAYSACFASEQLHSLSATLTKVTQNLRRLAAELSKPQTRFTEQGIRNKISRWLADSFVREVLHYELEQRENRWHLSFQVDHPALQQLWSQRLGRTVLLTNRLDWTAEHKGFNGGERGIRTLDASIGSASCRFLVAAAAINARNAVRHCSRLPTALSGDVPRS